MSNQERTSPATKTKSGSAKRNQQFRVGNVRGYLRGSIWYLYYHENGLRRRPRVGPDKDAARQMAAQINGQLEVGAPSSLSFEPISLTELRDPQAGLRQRLERLVEGIRLTFTSDTHTGGWSAALAGAEERRGAALIPRPALPADENPVLVIRPSPLAV